MLMTTVGSFVAIALFSLMPFWALGALCLALFGWLSAISSLLQYTLIQTQTPEAMLGGLTVCGPRRTLLAMPLAPRCWVGWGDNDAGRVGERQRLGAGDCRRNSDWAAGELRRFQRPETVSEV